MVYTFKIYYIVIIIVLIYICVKNCKKVNNNDIWYDFIKINSKSNISKILFYAYIGCGFANKIPTLLSSFLLSVVSLHPILIINWKQLLLYYNFPKSLFIQYYNDNNTKLYDKKNSTVLNLLKMNITIKIHTYHSFTNSVLQYYNITKNMKILMKQKKHITIEMLLDQIFLKPTKNITNYIKYFKEQSEVFYMIGIHIRTGYLSDFGERDTRFFNNNSVSLYINTINRIINKYKNSRLYITSDSTLIKEYFHKVYEKKLFNFSIPGKICHARLAMHGKMELNDCVVKLIAENYVLSECSIVIGSGTSTYFGMACRRKFIKCVVV